MARLAARKPFALDTTMFLAPPAAIPARAAGNSAAAAIHSRLLIIPERLLRRRLRLSPIFERDGGRGWGTISSLNRQSAARHLRTPRAIPRHMKKRTTVQLIGTARKAVPAKPKSGQRRPVVVLPASSATEGTLPGVDLNDTAALIDIMEGRACQADD
jgi:hypothetical protein